MRLWIIRRKSYQGTNAQDQPEPAESEEEMRLRVQNEVVQET